MKFILSLLSFVFIFSIGCIGLESSVIDTSISPSFPRLVIHNHCSYDIWMEHENLPSAIPSVFKIAAGDSFPVFIPSEGLASTRIWPKKGCDAWGNFCQIGQSHEPCSYLGCIPPVDSKLEVTWGCTLSDKSKCDKTPQGDLMVNTWWDSSLTDGFTFPFQVSVSGGDDRLSCSDADCSGISLSQCPFDEDLSDEGLNLEYLSEDLLLNSDSGCFSPCMKLNYPGYGGLGLDDPASTVEQMYCCPTPPVSSSDCNNGPVSTTQYSDLVHSGCSNTVYSFPYDDSIGLRNCSSSVTLEFVVGPDCP
jgi:hypothetical protein